MNRNINGCKNGEIDYPLIIKHCFLAANALSFGDQILRKYSNFGEFQ